MKQLAVIADTHIPERAAGIPDEFEDRIQEADHVIHAGDFTSQDVLNHVETLAAGDLTAVYGNMDPRNLDLPEVATLTLDDQTFVITHGTGSPRTYEDRVTDIVQEESGDDAVGIAGHTHEVLDTTVDDIRLLNPGSVTGADPASRTTMMTIDVEDDEISVTVHEH